MATDPVEPGSWQSSMQHSWIPVPPRALGGMFSHSDISVGILQPWSLEWSGAPSATLPANINARVNEVIRTHIDKCNFAGAISRRCCDDCLVVALNFIFLCRAGVKSQHAQFCNGRAVSICGSFGSVGRSLRISPHHSGKNPSACRLSGFWFNRGYVDCLSLRAFCNFHFFAGESARLLLPGLSRV